MAARERGVGFLTRWLMGTACPLATKGQKETHASLPDRRRIARASPDGHRRGFPSGVTRGHRGHRSRARAAAGGVWPGQAAEAGDRPRDHRCRDLPRRDHRGADHAPAGEQRRQARAAAPSPPHPAAATSTWPARSTTRPASARSSSAPAPARRRCAWPSGRWRGCCCASWGSTSSAMCVELGGIAAPPLVARPGGPRRQPGLHAQPAGRRGDRRGHRRGPGGGRHAGRGRRDDRDGLPDRAGVACPVGPQARRPARRWP